MGLFPDDKSLQVELLCQQVRAFLKFRICISCFSQCLQKCMSPTVSLKVSVYDIFWFVHSFIGNCSPQIKGRLLKIGRSIPKASLGTSSGEQWMRVRLPVQGTRVWPLVQESPTRGGATKPAGHNFWSPRAQVPGSCNYWASPPSICAPQREKPPPWGAPSQQRGKVLTAVKTQHSQNKQTNVLIILKTVLVLDSRSPVNKFRCLTFPGFFKIIIVSFDHTTRHVGS